MGIDHKLGHPPAFNAAVNQRRCGVMQAAVFHGSIERVANGVYPGFRGYVGLAFFHHRSQRWHGVAGYQLHVAVVALAQNKLVHVRQDFGRLPVHVGDGYAAAGSCRLRGCQKSGDRQRCAEPNVVVLRHVNLLQSIEKALKKPVV
jgi:hypothetical protein